MVFSPAKLAVVAVALLQAAAAETLIGAIGNQKDLSTLGAVLASKEALVSAIGASGKQITLLAPSNKAFEEFLSKAGPLDKIDPNVVDSVLSYHVVDGAAKSTDLNVQGGVIAKTFLSSKPYANLGGDPNVVYASAYGSSGLATKAGALKLYAGLGQEVDVSSADIEFDGGVIHIIDDVLQVPENVTTTAKAAGLSTLAAAVGIAELGEYVDTTPKLTIFAPVDSAFAAIGVDGNTPKADITKALTRHVIAGTVAYSNTLKEGEVETVGGEKVKITIKDGEVWVNNAKVIKANVITQNGVVHVVESVILPHNATNTGNGTTSPTPSPTTDADSAAGKLGASFLVSLAAGVAAYALL